MRFNRQRSDRTDSARHRLGSGLDTLETRCLLSITSFLSQSPPPLFSVYTPNDLVIQNPITGQHVQNSVQHMLATNPTPTNSLYGNAGKIVTGKDRQGDEWTITVHGPGYAIVTDTSPNDGSLDDAINTIQLVGTNINSTYVTGNVTASIRVNSDSTIPFNRLEALSGVRSIVLNGFSLADTVSAPGTTHYQNTGIYLPGGVRNLSFHNIIASIDTSTADFPITIQIGDSTAPLKVQPSIHLDSIFNTQFDSTATAPPNNVPVTTPTVNIIVNGQIKNLSFLSSTQDVVPAAYKFLMPVVSTTGRTSVQTFGINKLNVQGAATNLTASRSAQPFQSGFSGMSRLGSATFNGPTDAVGLDVNGRIGKLTYKKGMGNPSGVFVGTTLVTDPTTGAVTPGPQVPATMYGIPTGTTGYAAAGFVAGQVTAKQIGKLHVGPANVTTISPTNPDFVQLRQQGTAYALVLPGTAMVNSLVSSSGNIGKVHIKGNTQNSEIKTGFHYNSFAAGLEGTRAASRIGSVTQVGAMINADTSATVRPKNHVYGTTGSILGPGSITGKFKGALYNTGGVTPLMNTGAGFYAKTKIGKLPPKK